MIIKEDYSYVTGIDKKAIEQGVAVLGVHSIRLDRYITEEQGEQNRKAAKELSPEEWGKSCEQYARKIAAQNEIALSALETAGLILGQYRSAHKYREYWDLWFWCNSDNNGMRLDYVQLTLNDELSLEQQKKIVEQATAILGKVNTPDNRAIIQYEAIYDEEKLTNAAEKFAEENLGKFLKHGFYIGKIKKIDPDFNGGYKYAFMRKNAKKRGYLLSTDSLYAMSLENA